jgi:hypothetical protein
LFFSLGRLVGWAAGDPTSGADLAAGNLDAIDDHSVVFDLLWVAVVAECPGGLAAPDEVHVFDATAAMWRGCHLAPLPDRHSVRAT